MASIMKLLVHFIATLCILIACFSVANTVTRSTRDGDRLVPGFRPPSVPLVVVDPYLSLWSNSDHLYDDCPKHWSGSTVCLSGMIRIDGKPYRFMAANNELATDHMAQLDLKVKSLIRTPVSKLEDNINVYPTQTVYVFHQDGIQLNVTFSTPSFVDKGTLPVLPLTFLSYEITVTDGNPHHVQLYYDNTAQGVVSNELELVELSRVSIIGQVTMRVGTTSQNYFGQVSDRINWGYWYISTLLDRTVRSSMANSSVTRKAFITGQELPPDDTNFPRKCSDNTPVLALAWDFGMLQPNMTVSRQMSIAYDQVYSMKYFGTSMSPFWTQNYDNIRELIMKSGYEKIKPMCDQLDDKVLGEVYSLGGAKFATIASLAWRQAVAGTVTVWNNVTNTTWMFMKEISSDGDVSTVDVLYPASPLFVWYNPDSLKLLLLPILDYANNQTSQYGISIPYNLQWAPHHLGRWPVCLIKPSMQEQMPMEESGNMILMIAGIVHRTPSNDVTWLKKYWKLLQIWGDYIVSGLPDPGNQLCTDDFEGPSPHNVNLAAKGIEALAALAYILRIDGQDVLAEKYDQMNKNFINYWMEKALNEDHYRLQYNLPGTWSLKYNLLYQEVLGLEVFPKSVIESEEAYYTTKMNTYGVPLDSRADFTKTDWEMWVAALGSEEQFMAIVDAVYNFADKTPDRTPFTDWYYTTTGKRKGFTARPVIAGIFAKVLTTKTL